LDLQSEQVDRFTDEDLRAMTILADQIAVAIRNAQLFTEAQDALERAEAASKAKSVFLSNMSHELRTPLNMVIGYTSSMLNMPQMYDYQPLPEIFRPDIQLIEENGEYLLGLINDILDLSKIEVGKFEINCAPVDLNAIFEGVMATSIGLLKDKPLQLRPQYPDNLPKVWADNIRIRQVLLNLMSNAIKYSETGTVTLSAKVEGEQIRIAVTDTGIGIPQDALATIFDRFQQIQNNTTIQGTGLGLDISQRLVQLHGSELEVQSSIGQGSTFSFWLPIATPEQLRVEAPAAPQLMESGIKVFTESDWTSLSQRSILVVEDDADVRMLLRQALEGRGNLVIDTNDREQTLDMASGVLPHLIILDVDMKDGWEIMGDLQSNPDTSSIPVLLLAAYESVKRAETSKAAYVLRKPITVGDIQTAVADIFIGSVKQ
jgi:signal transduction histidine kinase